MRCSIVGAVASKGTSLAPFVLLVNISLAWGQTGIPRDRPSAGEAFPPAHARLTHDPGTGRYQPTATNLAAPAVRPVSYPANNYAPPVPPAPGLYYSQGASPATSSPMGPNGPMPPGGSLPVGMPPMSGSTTAPTGSPMDPGMSPMTTPMSPGGPAAAPDPNADTTKKDEKPAEKKDEKKKAPPKKVPQPWKPLFYDNDFKYKDDPNHDYIPGEELKDMPLEDLFGDLFEDATLSYGGELRFRYMNERNRLRPSGLTPTTFDLWRWRQYLDLKFGTALRGYVEVIDASIFESSIGPLGIDKNRWDIQNAFVDLQVGERDDKPIYFRYGRQELQYGSQRLVSALDWANTRRNFEGFKLFSPGEEWDLDMWLTRPVNTATPNNGPVARFDNSFDSPNHDRAFGGIWHTYKGMKDHTIDHYFLWDHSGQDVPGFHLGDRYTFALRWLGNYPYKYCDDKVVETFHHEIEGGYQVGTDRGRPVHAGFFVGGLGYTRNSLPWEPSFWAYYDWASGDRDPANGTVNTFFQHTGLVHAYLGQIDNLARQNISDLNFKFSVKPRKQFTVETQWHFYDLVSDEDFLYNVTGATVGATGKGKKVGREFDLVGTYVFNQNLSVQGGYFYFWYDEAVLNNGARPDASQLYFQTTLRY